MREASRYLSSRHDAEDVAQEALLRVWRQRHTCRSADDPVPWVARIARREALRRLARRTELAAAEAPEAPDQSAADDLELAVLRLDVARALAALRPEDRELLELRYRRDLTHVRAAAELGSARRHR